MIYYAHTKEDALTKKKTSKEFWQLLEMHLKEVERLSGKRAAKFGAERLGRIVGLAHDLGKYSEAFQRRLAGAPTKVDHSTAGAQELYRRFDKKIGKALAYIVAGHHGGLPDGHKGDPANLSERILNLIFQTIQPSQKK